MISDVQVSETLVVVPNQATPRKDMWLSCLDLLQVSSRYTPTVYLYRSAAAAAGVLFDVARLKESMARALVPFYPLAGRLGVDGDGRFVIKCNAEGALLVVARSNHTMDDFTSDPRPSPELKALFVPHVDEQPASIMLAVQVTFLKCGAVALGTMLHHVAGDAIAAFHFFQTWSTFSREGHGGATVGAAAPCHDRTLLLARSSPPSLCPDAMSVLCLNRGLDQPSGRPVIVTQAFTLSGDRVAALKRACGADVGISTFCAVSALVWQCVCVAGRLPPDADTRLTLPASIRRSIRPPLPDGFFGNAIIWLGACGVVRDIVAEPLAATASRISSAVRRMDDKMVRTAIDYFELSVKDGRPAPSGSCFPETDLRVVSWLGMPVYDADFGWGKPELFFRAESERPGLVYLMNDGGDGVRVVVCTEEATIRDLGGLLNAKMNLTIMTQTCMLQEVTSAAGIHQSRRNKARSDLEAGAPRPTGR
ncbi:hypothetical protein EJB05_50301, partial [Eragrostis curvula]